MLIAEKVLLLQLDENKNKLFSQFRIIDGKYSGGCLAVAFLLDLALKKKISFELTPRKRARYIPKCTVNILDDSPLEENDLDTLFSIIKDYHKERTFSKIRLKLVTHGKTFTFKTWWLTNTFLERLDKQGIIKHEIKLKGFRGGGARGFYGGGVSDILVKPEVKREIIQDIHAVVFDNKKLDLEMTYLLSIMNGFRLYAHMLNIFSKSNWKQARNRISKLTESFELLPVIIDEAKIIVYNS
jgi:hypothetical protein